MLDRVFQETRDSGFQEEKYESLILSLRWEKRDLLQVLDSRISALVKRRYTKASVSWTDVFPHKVGDAEVGDYIVSRTMYRPRDIIQFGNYCVQHAENRPAFTRATLLAAEGEYSEKRFRSCGDEFSTDYPSLLAFAALLKGRAAAFPLGDISTDDLDELLRTIDENGNGRLKNWIQLVYENKLSVEEFRRRIALVFYRVGLVGIRLAPGSRVMWSFRGGEVLRDTEISDTSRLQITPVFYRVLGTVTHGRKR